MKSLNRSKGLEKKYEKKTTFYRKTVNVQRPAFRLYTFRT